MARNSARTPGPWPDSSRRHDVTYPPTYLGSGDPARRRTDYHPVWLNDLADDVTCEAAR